MAQPVSSIAASGGASPGLKIQTFSNASGGNTLYKALSHPLAHDRLAAFIDELRAAGPMAVFDPASQFEGFAALYGESLPPMEAYYVQDVAHLDRRVNGCVAAPVTAISDGKARALLVAAFDADRLSGQFESLLPRDMKVFSFDSLKLPEDMLSVQNRYLHALNFATGFAFFRDEGGAHTRLVTANYWSGYGAGDVVLWLRLYDADGNAIAEWTEPLRPGIAGVVIDSRAVRERFRLREFTGSLFMHATGIAGHDVVKYALDTYGDSEDVLSCTHDANAWPADYYAGLPAPATGERVTLWVQNSHGVPIPPRSIGINPMGHPGTAWLEDPIPPFGTRAVDVGELLPGCRWPEQLEVTAGRYFVRPRYEVSAADGRSRIAHVNVERTDLEPDPALSTLEPLLGKGYLLPAPVLPGDRWSGLALPTPMARSESELPLAIVMYDADGSELARRYLGRIPRHRRVVVDFDELLADAGTSPRSGHGHVELLYDFRAGGQGNGWLHALFRYRDRHSGHVAETSFGSHVFNIPMTYRGEPQSYAGRPPGLTTRLFLRLGRAPHRTIMHLIYPASRRWHPESSTDFTLHAADGREITSHRVNIPLSGSLFAEMSGIFGETDLKAARDGGYVIIRDTTCRLFGYHGLLGGAGAFSLDHMFGF